MSTKDPGCRKVGSGTPMRQWASNSYDPATGRSRSSLYGDTGASGNHGHARAVTPAGTLGEHSPHVIQ